MWSNPKSSPKILQLFAASRVFLCNTFIFFFAGEKSRLFSQLDSVGALPVCRHLNLKFFELEIFWIWNFFNLKFFEFEFFLIWKKCEKVGFSYNLTRCLCRPLKPNHAGAAAAENYEICNVFPGTTTTWRSIWNATTILILSRGSA